MMMFKRILLVALVVLVAACSKSPPETVPVQLTVNLQVPSMRAPTGTVHLYTYNAYRGEGELRHPLGFIEEKLTFDYGDGQINHSFDYVLGSGEGFVVYAFLDVNGDGALCTPTERDEFSGLTVLAEEPSGEMTVDVELTSPCAGSERFFPPPM